MKSKLFSFFLLIFFCRVILADSENFNFAYLVHSEMDKINFDYQNLALGGWNLEGINFYNQKCRKDVFIKKNQSISYSFYIKFHNDCSSEVYMEFRNKNSKLNLKGIIDYRKIQGKKMEIPYRSTFTKVFDNESVFNIVYISYLTKKSYYVYNNFSEAIKNYFGEIYSCPKPLTEVDFNFIKYNCKILKSEKEFEISDKNIILFLFDKNLKQLNYFNFTFTMKTINAEVFPTIGSISLYAK